MMINFDEPVAGYYWLKTHWANTVTGEITYALPSIVAVAFVSWRRKRVWRVFGMGWNVPYYCLERLITKTKLGNVL